MNFQQLCTPFAKIPRPVWTSVVTIIYTVCAIAGRQHLLSIFLNFLALIGYWVIIWVAIVLEDEFLFRRFGLGGSSRSFDWTVWNDQTKLPVGVAALISFLIGWAGAIVCMGQTYYYGPIAQMIGDYGADVCCPSILSSFSWIFPTNFSVILFIDRPPGCLFMDRDNISSPPPLGAQVHRSLSG